MAMGSMTMTGLQLQAAICNGGRWWSDATIECPHDYSSAAMLAPFSCTSSVDLGGSSAAGGRFNWEASAGAPVDAMVAEHIVTYQDIQNPGRAYGSMAMAQMLDACSLRYALDCELSSPHFNGSGPFLPTPGADETSVHGLIQGGMYSSRPYCQQESDQVHTIRSTLDLLEDGREMSSNTDWDSVLFPASSVLLKRSPREPVDETLHHPFVETTAATQPKQQVQFTNEAPFWNPSVSSATELFSAQMRHSESIHELVHNDIKAKSSGAIKCSSSSLEENGDIGAVLKKARIETPSPLPTFKVRKEKFGDRITALQQLVSPFGKTDTASVLHEAIDYIKFLHDQIKVLGSPNSKVNGQTQRATEILKTNQDLRSRGLCLVPISSTVQMVARENPVDFWPFGFGAAHN